MNHRIKRIELRLTEAEAQFIREKSKGYRSVSQYIRDAVAEFSDTDAKRRLEVVKRANELAVAGLLSKSYLEKTVIPAVRGIEGTVSAIRSALLDVTKQATLLHRGK